MLSAAFVILLSFFVPKGAEAYLAEGSVYVEYQKADVTFSMFDEGMAMQAQAEFRETHAQPETARAGVVVMSIEDRQIADRSAMTIAYSKPAAVVKLNASGDVIVVEGVERTRQTYIDLGAQFLVLTVWSKIDDVNVAAISEELVARVQAGEGEAREGPAFQIGGVPIEAFAATLASDILGEPLRVDVTALE